MPLFSSFPRSVSQRSLASPSVAVGAWRVQEKGFTLIELLVSIAVLGILLSIALPNFADFLQRTQIERYAGELRGAVNYAKQQALRTGMRTSVCRRVAGQNQCSTSATEGWDAGWLVFHDVAPGFAAAVATDANNQYDAAAGEILLKVTDAAIEFKAKSVGPNAAALQPFVAFTGQGIPVSGQNFCVKLCGSSACTGHTNNRYLIVTVAGHTRIESESTISNAGNTGICL